MCEVITDAYIYNWNRSSNDYHEERSEADVFVRNVREFVFDWLQPILGLWMEGRDAAETPRETGQPMLVWFMSGNHRPKTPIVSGKISGIVKIGRDTLKLLETVTITDNGGTWSAGSVSVSVNGNDYSQIFDTDKNTSMESLADLIDTDPDVLSAVYSSDDHTILITPEANTRLYVTHDLSGITGSMTFTVGNAKMNGTREFMLYLQYIGADALDKMCIVRDSIEDPGFLDMLFDRGVTPVDASEPIEASEYLDSMPEERAVLDIRFRSSVEWLTNVGSPIEHIEAEGTLVTGSITDANLVEIDV